MFVPVGDKLCVSFTSATPLPEKSSIKAQAVNDNQQSLDGLKFVALKPNRERTVYSGCMKGLRTRLRVPKPGQVAKDSTGLTTTGYYLRYVHRSPKANPKHPVPFNVTVSQVQSFRRS